MTTTPSSTSAVVTVTSDSTLSTSSQFTDHYSNPLYLSPGDNLSIPIVGVKLTHENYHIWSRSMTVALSIKNKSRFVDGTYPAPAANDASYPLWLRCNFAVLNWILNSVSEDISQSLISYDDAASAWKDLKHRFSQGDAIRVADLQSRIASCDQEEDLTRTTTAATREKEVQQNHFHYSSNKRKGKKTRL
ncbi:hypothetical protein LINGRAHAP2_LOCUS1617, partial [Linum grandiflorum]